MRRAEQLLTILVAAAVLGATSSAHAQSKTGTTIGQFMNIEPGARLAAMGNAGAATPGGIQVAYFNPGAIGELSESAICFTHSEWYAEIDYNYAAVAFPVSGFGTLFASVTALNSGEIDVRTVDKPLGTGERYTVGDTGLTLGYGKQVTQRFAVGIQMNYVTERIWNSSVTVLTFGLGTVYRLTDHGLRLGFALTNFGTDGSYSGRDLSIQYDADPDTHGDNSALPATQWTGDYPVPVLFRVGLSQPVELSKTSKMIVSLDALHPSDNSETINLGAELGWRERLAVRAGYQTLLQEDTYLGLTLGFGIEGSMGDADFQVDYAWADHEYLGATHRFSMGVKF
jgi:hypothetical protein